MMKVSKSSGCGLNMLGCVSLAFDEFLAVSALLLLGGSLTDLD